jgi:hypothetical protein
MVDLETNYGNNLFSKKVYKSSKFIPIIASVIIDLIMAILIVAIFGIRQDYAILKVFGLMYLFRLAIRPIAEWPFNKLNIEFFLSKAVTSEIDHYLRVFNTGLTDDNSGCYEDYLLEAAFNESLDCKMRILAAIQYTKFVNLIEIRPKMDRVFLDAWRKVVRKYTLI